MARLLWSGSFGWFVQQRMRIPLIVATAMLLLFGAFEALDGSREEQDDAAASRRSAGPAIGWLLILPLVVLISVAPTGLGAAAADRVDAYTPTEKQDSYESLDASAGPVEMRVFDFLDRAIWDDARSLEGVTVRLEGLVVNDPEIANGFKLTRFLVSCCAADGIPLQVTVRDATQVFSDDTWVVADVVWRPPDIAYLDMGNDLVVEADAVTITEVTDARNDPYESPY